VPDASHEALVLCELLQSAPYEILAVLDGAVGVYSREQRPQVLAVAVGQVGELLGVSFFE
jgi:hypothetical protein